MRAATSALRAAIEGMVEPWRDQRVDLVTLGDVGDDREAADLLRDGVDLILAPRTDGDPSPRRRELTSDIGADPASTAGGEGYLAPQVGPLVDGSAHSLSPANVS